MSNDIKVLLAGESWIIHSIHIKGYDSFTSSGYGNGAVRLIEALETQGISVCHIPNHLAATDFPLSLEELVEYDVVILSDIGSNTLLLHPDTWSKSKCTPNRLELLREYVKNGGGFMMFGGYLSFQGFEGKGHYRFAPIADVLPVNMLIGDDRVEVPQGIKIRVKQKEHPIVKGVPEVFPPILSYNKLEAKDPKHVIVDYPENGDPMLIGWEYGKGRALAFAADCAPHGASTEFLDWEYYPKLWGQAVHWLARKL